MKKKNPFFMLMLLCLFLFLFPASIQEAKTATRVNPKNISLAVGETARLEIQEMEEDARWSSSNSKIVKITKISSDGHIVTIKAIKEGAAQIICEDDNQRMACKVIVKSAQTLKPDKPAKQSKPKKGNPEPVDLFIPEENVPDLAEENEFWTVTFDPNGGTVSPKSLDIVKGEKIGEAPIPERSGYTFLGWFRISSGSSLIVKPEDEVDSDWLCHAHWEEIPVITVKEIHAEYSGENVVVGGQVKKSAIKVTITYSDGNEVLTKEEEYDIKDYNIQEGENILTIVCKGKETKIIVLGEKTHDNPNNPDTPNNPNAPDNPSTPIQPPASYVTISFRSEGGSSVADISVAAGNTLSYVPTSTRAGYVFQGWYTRANGTGSMLTTSTRIDVSTIYYAYWIESSRALTGIRAYCNGAAYAGENVYTKLIVTAVYSNGTSENISGYNVSQTTFQEGNNIITVSYAGYSQSVTVVAYARSKTLKEINAEFKGGSAPAGTFSYYGNLIVTAYYSDGTAESVTGYTLSTQTIEPGTNVITVFYEGKRATFSVIGYKRSTIALKNVPDMTSLWVTEGSRLSEALEGYVPVRAGYVFDGWYLDEGYVQKVSSDIITSANMTVYAKWAKLYDWTLNRKNVKIKKGKFIRLSIDGLENSRITWTSSNKKIASVTKSGKVKAKRKGTAYITAVTYDGSILRCKIKVKK